MHECMVTPTCHPAEDDYLLHSYCKLEIEWSEIGRCNLQYAGDRAR